MLKKYLSIDRLILVVVIGVLLFRTCGNNDGDGKFTRKERKEMERKIEALEKEKQVLYEENDKLTQTITEKNNEIVEWKGLQQENQQEIDRLRYEQSKEVRAIDGFDSGELYEFFAGFETSSPSN